MTTSTKTSKTQKKATKGWALMQSVIGQDLKEDIVSKEFVVSLHESERDARDAFSGLAMSNNSKMCVNAFIREVELE